jgi:undecaprenyl-diphosphatase
VSWLGFPPQSDVLFGVIVISLFVFGARWAAVAEISVFLALMSFARVYAGHHWASDVFAGYLLGVLWLAVVIRFYCRGEPGRRRSSRKGYAASGMHGAAA